MTATPLDLFASALRFHPDGELRAGERQMSGGDSGAWQVATFRARSDDDLHADHWEMHPEAEEAVCCLAGGVRLYFRSAEAQRGGATVECEGAKDEPDADEDRFGGPQGPAEAGQADGVGEADEVGEAGGVEEAEEMVRLSAGTAVVVPRGRWHRLELDVVPSDLMSITLRRGTRLERRTDIDG